NAAELQGIDSTCNRVDSLSHFLRKIGFREQIIDCHDLRIDSENHRGQLIIRIDSAEAESILLLKMSRFFLFGIDSEGLENRVWAWELHVAMVRNGAGSSLESGEACCKMSWSRLSSGLSSFRCIFSGELESCVYESESSVCSATVSAERVHGAVSHIGVLHFECLAGFVDISQEGALDVGFGEDEHGERGEGADLNVSDQGVLEQGTQSLEDVMEICF
ncbi:hypothetical protein PIB30_071880, partial [Stylosanthes scabra]|nr:hypothetical protein [Stylosanthes scabra]